MADWVWPVENASITSINEADKPGEGDGHFGTSRSRGRHSGLDIAAPSGTPVLAAADGSVVRILPNPSTTYGTQMVIEHAGKIFTQYAHLAPGSVLFEPGSPVTAGVQIAQVGRSGNTPSRGDSHLHFEVRLLSAAPRTAGGRVDDPLLYLPR